MLKRLVLTASAIALAAATTVALAQTTPPSNVTRGDARVVRAIQSAKVSIVQAIDAAEQRSGQGSRAIEVDFEVAKDGVTRPADTR
jgi:hypothetical protein